MLPEGRITTVVARDRHAAERCMAQSFCSHRLETGSGERVTMRHIAVRSHGSAFNQLEYGAGVEVRSEGFERFYMLELPLQGGVEIEFGRQTVTSTPGHALLLSPGPQFRSRWRPQTRQWMLQIETARVEDRLARLTRRPVGALPVFNPLLPLDTEPGRRLVALFAALSADLTSQEETDSLRQAALTDGVIDLLLTNLPFASGASLVPARISATPRHVKRALDLFHARYAERLSMAEVADTLEVSERALYEGFQRFYQTSPYDMLTRIRMDKARALLRHEGVSVAEAARRSGFHHLGRFSAAYRTFFGILPSADAVPRH